MLLLPAWVSAQGFSRITPIVPAPIVKNTAEKPQSKVWYHDGKWWAVFSVADGTFVGRLDGGTWNLNLKISSSTSVEADCKVLDDVCHIFLWRKADNPSQFVSIEYDNDSESYRPWSLRTQLINIPLEAGAETGTIDIDSRGTMWLGYDGVDDIRVRWSDPPYAVWNGPVIIATGVTDDDISALISLPVQGQVGVLWSNQNTRRFGFKTHVDGDAPATWSKDEVPSSASALDVGMGMADDHLNLAMGSDGSLYCAVKTSYDTPGFPRLALLRRSPAGRWDDLYEVSQSGTRAIVVLNEFARKLKVIYTSAEDGGQILYRESAMSKIEFSEPLPLIDGVYNNPTSSKDNYQHDILILASNDNTLVGVLANDDPSVTVGIDPFESAQSGALIACYPNPVQHTLHLDFGDEIGATISVSVIDASGKTCFQPHGDNNMRSMEIDVDKLNLAPGFYHLIVKSATGSEVVRFIKQ